MQVEGNDGLVHGCALCCCPTQRRPGGGGSAPAAKPVCRYSLSVPAKEVPCSSEQGWWVQSRQCYARVASPQPAASDPVWEGRTEGAVYDCYRPFLGPGGFLVAQFWSASPPGVGAPPDPRTLAQQAVEAGTPLPPLYWRYARWWEWLGYPAFAAMVVVFYLMVAKPG